MNMTLSFFIATLSLATLPVQAGPCDYSPSKLIGAGATGVSAAIAGATAAAGASLKAAGFYTITHAVTGATMLASTAGGASAAGTVGILGGTAGAIGTAGAVLMSPFVIIPGVIVAGGVATYEGACYLANEK